MDGWMEKGVVGEKNCVYNARPFSQWLYNVYVNARVSECMCACVQMHLCLCLCMILILKFACLNTDRIVTNSRQKKNCELSVNLICEPCFYQLTSRLTHVYRDWQMNE